MQIKTYRRHIRYRNGVAEVVIPPPIVRRLGFRKHIKTAHYDSNKIVDQNNKLAMILIWINKEWNIEFGLNAFYTQHVNGILLTRYLYLHGSSVAFSIPHEIIKTLEAVKRSDLDEFEMFVNKNGKVELNLLS